MTPEDLIKEGMGINEEGQFYRLEPTPMPEVSAEPLEIDPFTFRPTGSQCRVYSQTHRRPPPRPVIAEPRHHAKDEAKPFLVLHERWDVYVRLDRWRGRLAAGILGAAYWSLRKLGGRANVQITVAP